MKKIIFTFILVSGLAFAASAQSNNESAVQVQSAGQTVSESAATPPGQDKMNETPADKANCGTKSTSTASGKKKCCADGKKASASCHEAKSDMKKEEKISE